MLGTIVEVTAAGVLAEFALHAANALFASAGLGAGSFRAWAILTRRPPETIRWWTAIGSVSGAGLMILFVLVDLIAEGG